MAPAADCRRSLPLMSLRELLPPLSENDDDEVSVLLPRRGLPLEEGLAAVDDKAAALPLLLLLFWRSLVVW